MILQKNNKITKCFIFLILLAIFFLGIYLISLNGLLLWDEPVYLGNAASHIRESHFQEDFRFPLLEYIIASVWALFGESILVTQLTMLLFSVGSVYVFYLLSKEFFKKEKNVFLATIMYGFSSQLIFWSFRIYADVICVFFTILAFYFFIKKNHKNQNLYMGLAGIFSTLAFLSRFAFIIPFIFVLYLLLKKKFKKLIYFIGGCIFVAIPWIIFNIITYGNPFWDFFAQFDTISEYTKKQSGILFLGNLVKVFSLSLIFIIPYVIDFVRKIRIKKLNEKELLLFVTIILSALFYMFVVKLKLLRYTLAVIPFIIIAIIIGLNYSCGLTKKQKSKKAKKIINLIFIIIILISILIPTGIIFNKIKITAVCESDGAIKDSIVYIKKNTNPGDTINSNNWPIYGYFANLKAMSTWTNNISLLISTTSPKYIIFNSRSGLDIDRKILDNHNLLTLEKEFKDNCNQEILIYKVKN